MTEKRSVPASTWTLPEPARGTWAAHGDTIRGVIEALDQNATIVLGGGTLLAAQWKHRRSTDIDITVPGLESLVRTHRGQKYDLEALTGGRFGRQEANHTEVLLHDGRIDIATYTPRPEGLEHEKTVLGRIESRATPRSSEASSSEHGCGQPRGTPTTCR